MSVFLHQIVKLVKSNIEDRVPQKNMTASKAIKDYCIKKEPTTAHKSKNNFSIKQLNKSQLYVLYK